MTKLINDQHNRVQASYIEFHETMALTNETAYSNSFTPLQKVLSLLSRFPRKLLWTSVPNFIILLRKMQNTRAKFHLRPH
jgi:hypothetical protein